MVDLNYSIDFRKPTAQIIVGLVFTLTKLNTVEDRLKHVNKKVLPIAVRVEERNLVSRLGVLGFG